ncbi:MAG: ACT domain-containing protein [Planctomycetota bacterium]|nr:MAG: ACT domain-containing protein [Planctomycetota bacterium]
MSFRVEPGRFALAGFPEPPAPADFAALAPPAQMIREADETSLLITEGRLPGLLARHPSARVERGLVWIRFDAPMGWEVVGFLALVTGRLASAGVPIGAVCGYSRDHLFVAERYLERTRAVLAELFPEIAGDGASPPSDD